MYDIKQIVKKYKDANILILGNGNTSRFDTSEYWSGINEEGYCWTVNGSWLDDHPESDLGFMMDDWLSPAHDHDFNPRDIKEKRLKEDTKIPIITNTWYEGFDCFVEFPLVDVYKHFGSGYFGETISYMVAFAIYCGAKRIHMHGTDYFGCKPSERACTEHWVGRALERGIQVITNPNSHFMKTELDGKNNHIPFFYGYIPESFPFNYRTDEHGRLIMEEKPR